MEVWEHQNDAFSEAEASLLRNALSDTFRHRIEKQKLCMEENQRSPPLSTLVVEAASSVYNIMSFEDSTNNDKIIFGN